MNRNLVSVVAAGLLCCCIAAASKQPIPTSAQIKDATDKVRMPLQKEYADPAAAGKLAAKLLDQLSLEKKPAELYVCCTDAYDLAKKAGDAGLALRAVDAMELRFDGVDALAMEMPVLAPLAQKPPPPDACGALLQQGLEVYLIALARDDKVGEAARDKLVPVLRALAPKARPPATTALVEFLKDGNLFARKKGSGLQALARAKAVPADAAAHEAAGRWLCFASRQWEEGLPYLAKGQEPDIKRLAQLELDATDAKHQLEVAKQWAVKSVKLGLDPLAAANVRSHARELCARVALISLGFEHDDALASRESIELMGRVGVSSAAPTPKAKAHTTRIAQLTFTRDNSILISLSQDGTIASWDVSSAAVISMGTPHTRGGKIDLPTSFVPSVNGKYVVLVTSGTSGVAGMSDLKTMPHWIRFVGYAFSKDGSVLLAANHDDMSAIATIASSSINDETQKLALRTGGNRRLRLVILTPDEKFILGGYDDGVSAFTTDKVSNTPLWTAPASSGIDKLRVSPDAKSVWAVGFKGTIWQINMVTGSIVTTIEQIGERNRSNNLPEIGPDTTHWLAWNGKAGTGELWDAGAKKPTALFGGASLTSVCWLPDSHRFLWADGGTMHLADLSGHDLTTIETGKTAISNIAVSPNGLWAATGSAEGDVRLWPMPVWRGGK